MVVPLEFFSQNGVGKTCLWKKNILLCECIQKQGKNFLKSYIVLLSCHLTSTGRLAHWAGIDGTVLPSKGQCTISNILSSLIFSLFIEQYILFPETCFANIISEPKFMVCLNTRSYVFQNPAQNRLK